MVKIKEMIKVGSDFSGVGAFNQALIRLGIPYKEVFACDMDKYARQTFIHNYGEPEYYPKNVYERDIPSEPLDIYMTSPPCQAFSLAGKRLGKEDQRGILFYNSHEFIKVNKPRYFIFENVKGLLSDDNGKTFQEWVNLLGGKSVNGDSVLFPYPDSVPYHLYWKVINAKDHGVPQNRERVFLIGIRDDKDNNFRWPVEEHLTKKLKDVLEENVNEKYFLSHKMLELITYQKKGNIEIGNINKGGQKGVIADSEGMMIGCLSATDYKLPKLIQISSSVLISDYRADEGFRWREDGNSPTIMARAREDGSGKHLIQYNNTRLNKTLEKHQLPEGEVKMIDSYNQSIHDNSITISTRVDASNQTHLWNGSKIRRLTPRECFRLMDFPDTFTWPVSDSQAYKQAGNSIVVNVLYKIIANFNL